MSLKLASCFSDNSVVAAHCIQDKWRTDRLAPDYLVLRIGSFNLKAANEFGSTEKNVSRIDINPAWDIYSEKWDADIAILFMSHHVSFTSNIQPVCLPVDSKIERNSQGFVVRKDFALEASN